MPPQCRLLPFVCVDGPHNMAADEVLLQSASAGFASLRFYCWQQPTISLGYFQSEQVRRGEKWADLPFVRRPSGGDLLVHDRELTYALALPAGPPWQDRTLWVCRMHGIIGTALSDLGVNTGSCALEANLWAGVLCFQHATPGDVLINGHKVVGSAQRRRRGYLLQHGGILLGANKYAPELPGINELTGQDLNVDQLSTALKRAFVQETGWNLLESEWTKEEEQLIEELVATKYSQTSWNCKR